MSAIGTCNVVATTAAVRVSTGYTRVWTCSVRGCGCNGYTYCASQAEKDAADHAARHQK